MYEDFPTDVLKEFGRVISVPREAFFWESDVHELHFEPKIPSLIDIIVDFHLHPPRPDPEKFNAEVERLLSEMEETGGPCPLLHIRA